MELTKQDREFIAAVEANTPKDFPNLVCGWPDEEYSDLSHWKYIQACCDAVDATPDGEDVPTIAFPTFKEWRRKERDSFYEIDNLGFSRTECDLCGALAGDRYAATALPDNPAENKGYVPLSVCGDCLQYIANGELPEES